MISLVWGDYIWPPERYYSSNNSDIYLYMTQQQQKQISLVQDESRETNRDRETDYDRQWKRERQTHIQLPTHTKTDRNNPSAYTYKPQA